MQERTQGSTNGRTPAQYREYVKRLRKNTQAMHARPAISTLRTDSELKEGTWQLIPKKKHSDTTSQQEARKRQQEQFNVQLDQHKQQGKNIAGHTHTETPNTTSELPRTEKEYLSTTELFPHGFKQQAEQIDWTEALQHCRWYARKGMHEKGYFEHTPEGIEDSAMTGLVTWYEHLLKRISRKKEHTSYKPYESAQIAVWSLRQYAFNAARNYARKRVNLLQYLRNEANNSLIVEHNAKIGTQTDESGTYQDIGASDKNLDKLHTLTLDTILAKVPASDRKLATMVSEGQQKAQIAKELGINPKTVYNRTKRLAHYLETLDA